MEKDTLFTIYSSSAGSGKTFTLTREYISTVLAAQEDDYFKRILAMTFTNEAAEQMKERIISTLKGLANQDSTAEAYKEQIQDATGLSHEDLARKSRKVLHEILQNYNDFAIKTIDSFVNQVIQSFAIDLKLPYNYEIVLDTNTLIEEAVNRLTDKVGQDEELTLLYSDFAEGILENEGSWNNLREEIIKFAKVIYDTNNGNAATENLHLTQKDINVIRKQITDYIKDVDNRIKNGSERLRQLLPNINSDQFVGKSRGIYSILKKLSAEEIDLVKFNVSDTAQLALDTGNWEKRPSENIEELKAITYEILPLVLDEKLKLFKTINKELLKVPFINKIKGEIDNILKEKNQAILADFNDRIAQIVSEEPVPFIYERIGEKYNHIFIDEFQDTSTTQFLNLLPLIENSLAKGYKNLIVGDPKQAIYSWRGGNVLLMVDLIQAEAQTQINFSTADLSEHQSDQIKLVKKNTGVEELVTNRRSRGGLIHFNNELFQFIIDREIDPISHLVFSSVKQEVYEKNKIGGYTEVEAVDSDQVQEKLLNLINELTLVEGSSDSKYSFSDICIITRKRDEGKICADILSQNNIPIRTDDALLLNSYYEVRFLVAGLRLAMHPERTFEKFEFLQFYSFLFDATGFDLKALSRADYSEYLAFFKAKGIDLGGFSSLDPYQMTEFLIARFKLLELGKNTQFVLAFLDFVLNFTNKVSKNLFDLLKEWENKKVNLALTSPPSDAVTITTIHKSKGLEYEVVIVPFINWSVGPTGNDKLWIKLPDYPEFYSEEKRLETFPLSPGVKYEFAQETISYYKQMTKIENLNLLYVALTRAKQRQYLWLVPKNKKYGIGEYLLQFIGEADKNCFGEKAHISSKKVEIKSEKAEFPPAFGTDKKLNVIWRPDTQEVEIGNLFHDAMQRIQFAEEVDAILNKMLIEGQIEDKESLKSDIDKVVNHPKLKDLYSSRAQIKNETEILSSTTQARRPDRVVFFEDKVYILDYKTGKKSKYHAKQLKDYASLLRQMGHHSIVLYLIYLHPFEVVEVN